MPDEEGNQFVAYFTPREESMEKRRVERAMSPDYVSVLSLVFE